MRAVVALALLALAASLRLPSESYQPKFWKKDKGVNGTTLTMWQRPRGEVKGIFLYMHGCGGGPGEAFAPKGKDGFLFEGCHQDFTLEPAPPKLQPGNAPRKNDKLKEAHQEVVQKRTMCISYPDLNRGRAMARKAGYIFVTVQGGNGNRNGCSNTKDVPHFEEAIAHIREEEKAPDVPIILTGWSSGGRVTAEIAARGLPHVSCIAPMANEIRVFANNSCGECAELKPPPNYPKNVAAIFLHCPRDGNREAWIQKNIQQMKQLGVRTSDIKMLPIKVDKEYLELEGFGLTPERAEKTYKQLEKQLEGGYVPNSQQKNHNSLAKTVFGVAVGENEVFMGMNGDDTKINRLLQVAGAVHTPGGRFIPQIIQFCEGK
jgi:hypothetical protein